MTFIDSVKTCYKKSFVIDGRASRSEYWWFFLFSYLVVSPTIVLAVYLSPSFGSNTPLYVISLISYLAVIFPMITVSVRRLHDLDKDGKIIIPYIFIDLISWIDLFYKLDTKLIFILDFIWYVLFVYFIIIFMFKGSNKKNKYGSPIKL